MKSILINLLKYGISIAIIAYLVVEAYRNQAFSDLRDQPKNWSMLVMGCLWMLVATVLTFVRWFMLVRALGLPFRMADAFRLGFLGYLLNFVSVGSVGGDLFKAVFVAKEHPSRRAEAVATVVIDRVLGLYGLFLVASAAILYTDQLHSPAREIVTISQATLACTCAGAVGILLMLVPGFTGGRVSHFLGNLKRTGPLFQKLILAVRIYRRKRGLLVSATVLSMGVHISTALCVYFISRGLPGEYPTLQDHFVAVPLAAITGVLPLPASGLGAFEYALDFLYIHINPAIAVKPGQGLVVALGYRVVTILVAMIGAVYYLSARREMAAVMHEAESAAA